MREANWNPMPAAVAPEPKNCWVPVDRRSIGESLEMCTEHMLEEHHNAITSRLENSFKVEVHITLVSSSKQNHKQERSFPRGRDSSPDGYITVRHDYKLPVRHDFKLGARYECTAMCWGPIEATHLLLTNSKQNHKQQERPFPRGRNLSPDCYVQGSG
jgi:hypothetical protein